MTAPTLLPGNRFRLMRGNGASPEVFTFVCIAQTKGLTKTNEYEDATVPDCDNPTSIPNRKSIVRSHQWGLTFSGICDAKQFRVIDQDCDSETPINYQLLIDKPVAEGGGTWTGPIYFETLTVTSTNNGLVNFNATTRGDDKLTWLDAAA
jgi:tail tube protein